MELIYASHSEYGICPKKKVPFCCVKSSTLMHWLVVLFRMNASWNFCFWLTFSSSLIQENWNWIDVYAHSFLFEKIFSYINFTMEVSMDGNLADIWCYTTLEIGISIVCCLSLASLFQLCLHIIAWYWLWCSYLIIFTEDRFCIHRINMRKRIIASRIASYTVASSTFY